MVFLYKLFLMIFLQKLKNSSYQDCTEIKEFNRTSTSGVYKIHSECRDKVSVYCDMDTDGGGWTVSNVFYSRSHLVCML